MLKDLARMTRPIQRKISNMVGRAVLRAINDGTGTQTMQVELLKGELYDGVERFQEYGFTSHPLAGAETVMVSVGGVRGHGIIVACEDKRYRITSLEAGEVALYTDEDLDGGHRVHLKRGKEIELLSGTTASILQTPTKTTVTNATEIELVSGSTVVEVKPASVTMTVGAVSVVVSGTGVAITGGTVKHNGINIGDNHQHIGSPTAPLGPISNTGTPIP